MILKVKHFAYVPWKLLSHSLRLLCSLHFQCTLVFLEIFIGHSFQKQLRLKGNGTDVTTSVKNCCVQWILNLFEWFCLTASKLSTHVRFEKKCFYSPFYKTGWLGRLNKNEESQHTVETFNPTKYNIAYNTTTNEQQLTTKQHCHISTQIFTTEFVPSCSFVRRVLKQGSDRIWPVSSRSIFCLVSWGPA